MRQSMQERGGRRNRVGAEQQLPICEFACCREAQCERLGVEIRYDAPRHEQTVVERDVMEMQAELQAARLLTWRAASMMTHGKPNNLESSVCKAKTGRAVREITQGCIEILGSLGVSREHLLEKWFRDVRITDIYEGTGEIQRMIIARGLLGYTRKELN